MQNNIQMIMMPIFLFVPVLICALLFWDDPCSLEKTREKIKSSQKTIGSSAFIIRSRDKQIDKTFSFMYIKAELRHAVRDTMVSDDTPMKKASQANVQLSPKMAVVLVLNKLNNFF